jgi:hypothetical protein
MTPSYNIEVELTIEPRNWRRSIGSRLAAIVDDVFDYRFFK